MRLGFSSGGELQCSDSVAGGAIRLSVSREIKENLMKSKNLLAVVLGALIVFALSLPVMAQSSTQSTTSTTTQQPQPSQTQSTTTTSQEPAAQSTQTTNTQTKYKHHKVKQTDTTTTTTPPTAGATPRPRMPHFGLAVICFVLFLTFLDNTIISASLGDVQSSLHAGVSQLQWVVSGYALTFASLMLICGTLG